MNTTIASNATDVGLASSLTCLGDMEMGQGTLVSLQVKKKGVARGPAESRIIYGNDFVHVLLWSGFHYLSLVERSHKKLHEEWSKGHLFRDLIKAVQDAGFATVTVDDVAKAVQELDESLRASMDTAVKDPLVEGAPVDDEEGSVPVWEPLMVNGVVIQGAKVYVGPGNLDDPRAPVKGSIYIDGVKLGEKVLSPAPNGHWNAKQKPKTVAKDILRSQLPIGLYARYCLTGEQFRSIEVGQKAGEAAKTAGILIEPEAIRSLFKIAA